MLTMKIPKICKNLRFVQFAKNRQKKSEKIEENAFERSEKGRFKEVCS